MGFEKETVLSAKEEKVLGSREREGLGSRERELLRRFLLTKKWRDLVARRKEVLLAKEGLGSQDHVRVLYVQAAWRRGEKESETRN